MKIARVFPRKTKASPDDDMAFFGPPDLFIEADEVHVSVAFTYDIKKAEELERQWKYVAPVKIGGPAFGKPGGNFKPGMYLKNGYVITSRGCPNNCWFCSVSQREGTIRELPIREGWNVLDDNLLACSDDHVQSVFDMLYKQKNPIQFTGGLEAARLKNWHVQELRVLKPKQLFFAYDTPDDLDPLVEAGKKLLREGFTVQSHTLRCYVLIGYKGDTFEEATKRLNQTITAGFTPAAMLYRDETGIVSKKWAQFQRQWARPAIIWRKGD